jgi:hypothetical protein
MRTRSCSKADEKTPSLSRCPTIRLNGRPASKPCKQGAKPTFRERLKSRLKHSRPEQQERGSTRSRPCTASGCGTPAGGDRDYRQPRARPRRGPGRIRAGGASPRAVSPRRKPRGLALADRRPHGAECSRAARHIESGRGGTPALAGASSESRRRGRMPRGVPIRGLVGGTLSLSRCPTHRLRDSTCLKACKQAAKAAFRDRL